MSALEEIAKAIEKLTAMQSERGYFELNGYLCEESPGDTARSYLEPDQSVSPLTNDELIVTLHRTIDAQLAILLDGVKRWNAAVRACAMVNSGLNDDEPDVMPEKIADIGTHADLARAINGGTS
ncbi:hypothetical protein [Subtercola endophyticus]|uniref:hypothetical protein n=1 Tax=Subtercola endophyticus TaxID=2895559 RepID=UPI001E36A089|nr:hypothetical protein [Subtercola endophyticus]UFS59504.1 hypothetical protein LQ955_01500 [Subtercola endophyticus]